MVSRVLSMLLEFGAFSVILHFVSVDGLEVFFVDGWICCPALLRLAAGLTLSAHVGLCVWSGPACFQPFSLLAALVLHGSFVVVLLYQVVFDGLVLCISAPCCSSDELRRVPVDVLPCVGSCIVLLALQFMVRVAGPCKVKKLPGKSDFHAHLCSLLLFLPCRVSGCAVAAILCVYGQNVCVGLAAAACGAFLLNCVLVMCFCSDEPGPLGEHGYHVTALGTLEFEISVGFTVTSAMVLARDLCRLPGGMWACSGTSFGCCDNVCCLAWCLWACSGTSYFGCDGMCCPPLLLVSSG